MILKCLLSIQHLSSSWNILSSCSLKASKDRDIHWCIHIHIYIYFSFGSITLGPGDLTAKRPAVQSSGQNKACLYSQACFTQHTPAYLTTQCTHFHLLFIQTHLSLSFSLSQGPVGAGGPKGDMVRTHTVWWNELYDENQWTVCMFFYADVFMCFRELLEVMVYQGRTESPYVNH